MDPSQPPPHVGPNADAIKGASKSVEAAQPDQGEPAAVASSKAATFGDASAGESLGGDDDGESANVYPAGGGDAVGSAASRLLKKADRKKRKLTAEEGAAKKLKRKKEKEAKSDSSNMAALAKKKKKPAKKPPSGSSSALLANLEAPGLTPAQIAVNEQMRKALEEDQYSANGSIVDTDTDDDDHQYVYKGQSVRLDRTYLTQAARKHSWLGGGTLSGMTPAVSPDIDEDSDKEEEEEEILVETSSKKSKPKSSKDKKKPRQRNQYSTRGKEDGSIRDGEGSGMSRELSGLSSSDEIVERDEGSIFGQTTGASNATWVECDKCKKWRRLRGVVDERKLPPKWYCSMNKNDPERARCSAPEEEYDAAHTPESAADARTRKHLRVWVRRLQCNEQYESRQPTLTRGKKRAVASSSKEPHEWIRCCNPSCGKWRACLRIMDAKQNVIDRTTNGEWYCVMNTWDEKTASCAAPQENLPAVGVPPWVMQDE